mmetsp:Transcript_27207/g.70087  ORF Transcript_27207/g.70087 Transcript_27207/m.70087 type:complete len:320 (-) Transcript_27207:556-1515(-)
MDPFRSSSSSPPLPFPLCLCPSPSPFLFVSSRYPNLPVMSPIAVAVASPSMSPKRVVKPASVAMEALPSAVDVGLTPPKLKVMEGEGTSLFSSLSLSSSLPLLGALSTAAVCCVRGAAPLLTPPKLKVMEGEGRPSPSASPPLCCCCERRGDDLLFSLSSSSSSEWSPSGATVERERERELEEDSVFSISMSRRLARGCSSSSFPTFPSPAPSPLAADACLTSLASSAVISSSPSRRAFIDTFGERGEGDSPCMLKERRSSATTSDIPVKVTSFSAATPLEITPLAAFASCPPSLLFPSPPARGREVTVALLLSSFAHA